MTHIVCLIPGDGIGPEVTSATREVIEAANVDVDWVNMPAGETALEYCGSVLPERTVAAIAGHGIALKGPLTTATGHEHLSVSVELRKRLDLFAAVRHLRTPPDPKNRSRPLDIIIIRENTEGIYSCFEHEVIPGVVQSLTTYTTTAARRLARFAFPYARANGRRKVTVFHKATIMRKADGLFLKRVRKVYQGFASDIEYDELIIDGGCAQLVANPSQFDVVLLSNLYDDLLTNLAAGLVGGIGVIPGASFGDHCAVFEPVHGSAPDIALKNLANPLACILSGAMMLDHLNETEAAQKVRKACDRVLNEANPEVLTPDLGGQGGTRDLTAAVIRAMT